MNYTDFKQAGMNTPLARSLSSLVTIASTRKIALEFGRQGNHIQERVMNSAPALSEAYTIDGRLCTEVSEAAARCAARHKEITLLEGDRAGVFLLLEVEWEPQ